MIPPKAVLWIITFSHHNDVVSDTQIFCCSNTPSSSSYSPFSRRVSSSSSRKRVFLFFWSSQGAPQTWLACRAIPSDCQVLQFGPNGSLGRALDRQRLAQYETRVFFDSVVRANLSFGQLKVLEGMSREELFLWLPVKYILVTDPSSGLIVIDIGLAFKHLSLSRFEDPPICRSHSGTLSCPFSLFLL